MKCVSCEKEVCGALAIRIGNEASEKCYFVCLKCVKDPKMVWPAWDYLELLAEGYEDEWVSPDEQE